MVETNDVVSAIPPAISQAPKERPLKVNEAAELRADEPEKPKRPSERDEMEITKIRAKHAQEQAAQRCVAPFRFLTFTSTHGLPSSSRQSEIERMEADIRKLSRRGHESDEEPTKKKPKKSFRTLG